MSSSSICARGKHSGTTFILSCLKTVFSEPPLHGRWLPAEQLRQYMHMKCHIGDDINFTLSTMMRVINKVLPLVSSEPNIMEIAGDVQLRVFRYMFQNRTRRYFFWVSAKVGVIPSMPSQRNGSAWEIDSVLTRLLSRAGQQQVQEPLDIDMCLLEPEPKRHKGLAMQPRTTNTVVLLGTECGPSETELAPVTNHDGVRGGGGWWESGDARRLFAPCTILYGSRCNVKDIVMERIEILESVNRSAANWKNVIDTSMGCSFLKGQYSESDVFSLRYRSMYLALALKQFVLNVTGNLRTQWTWKRCLHHAIEAMNDVGVEIIPALQLWLNGTGS
jgi:hypothetical protein